MGGWECIFFGRRRIYLYTLQHQHSIIYTPPHTLACSTYLRGEDAVELVVGAVRVGRGGRAHRLLPHLALVPVFFRYFFNTQILYR